MALLFEGSTCAICKGALFDGRPFFCTGDGLVPPTDPLWECCDAGIHWDCYRAWPHRDRLAASAFESEVWVEAYNQYWSLIYHDERILLQLNAAYPTSFDLENGPTMEMLLLALRTLPISFSIPMEEWEGLLREGAPDDEVLVREAFDAVRPVLRAQVPTPASIRARIDPDRKSGLAASIEEKEREWKQLADRVRRVRAAGATCPACGLHHHDYIRSCRVVREQTGLGVKKLAPSELTAKGIECRRCGHLFDIKEGEQGDPS